MRHSDSSSSLLNSLLSIDAKNGEVLEPWCKPINVNKKLSNIKQRISRLSIQNSILDSSRLSFMETKSTLKSLPRSKNASQDNLSMTQVQRIDELKLKMDKYSNLNSYYKSLLKQSQENIRITVNQILVYRDQEIERINSKYEAQINLVKDIENQIHVKIQSCILENEKAIEDLDNSIGKIKRNSSRDSFRYRLSSPQPEIYFEDLKIYLNPLKPQNKAVQVDFSDSLHSQNQHESWNKHKEIHSSLGTNIEKPLRIKIYLPDSYNKYCPALIQLYTTAQQLVECLKLSNQSLAETASLALKQNSQSPLVPLEPKQIISQLPLGIQEWPKLYLVNN